jgi:hypothetical protein
LLVRTQESLEFGAYDGQPVLSFGYRPIVGKFFRVFDEVLGID